MIFFKKSHINFLLTVLFLAISFHLSAQISPGDLSKSHANLEGVSNCTQCHSVGNKVTREKCLDCHKEIKANILAKKGYHSSPEAMRKNCAECHTDHHGKEFNMIKLNKKLFNHNLTGFVLKGEHAKQECKACHNSDNIQDPKFKKKPSTFMGLKQECLTCHEDYHQGKLSSKCTECHGFDTFKKATGFDHSKTKFPLLGKHQTVKCVDCHKIEIINGKKFQKFNGLKFANCTACHEDVHKNKFGQDCKRCHTEESFFFNKSMKAFDHDKTDFKLIGEHRQVDCKECHKTGKLTDPIKHDQCQDCHKDFHKGEFTHRDGTKPDCNQCHTNNGFTPSTFSIEKHNKKFKLEGAHLATSCMGCHKKEGTWTFRKMGKRCVDCHKNEHEGKIEDKFMPNKDCSICHNVVNWKKVKFDHDKTGYKLEGEHAQIACAECHYGKNENGVRTQQFKGMTKECSSCHKDSHAGQFAVNGKTDCSRCHGFDKFENSKFDHNTSRFKLDGAHATAKCEQCHKPVMDNKGKYIQYKFNDIACVTCHK
jgi:hypothetical protein